MCVYGCFFGCSLLVFDGVRYLSWVNIFSKKFRIWVKRESFFFLVGWLILGVGFGE